MRKKNREHSTPLSNTRARLEQAHALWHQALASYPDPNAFTANLNATIEAIRSVTFMLQNEKAEVPNFDEWYEKWREEMKADPVLRWLSEARTTVVHKSDLETTSSAQATIRTYLPIATATFDVPPCLPTEMVAQVVSERLPEPYASNRKDLIVSVERQWRVTDLPGYEVLDALAHVFGRLSQLVSEAVQRCGCSFRFVGEAGIEATSTKGDGRPPCMITTFENRTVQFSLADDSPFVHVEKEFSSAEIRAAAATAKRRYDLNDGTIRPLQDPRDPIAFAESTLNVAKKMLRRDKYHDRIIFLLTPKGWNIAKFVAADRSEKYALMQILAEKVRREGATALIDVGETWLGSVEEARKGRMPSEARDREEALVVTVAASSGLFRQYVTPFTRSLFGKIRFGETTTSEDTVPFYLFSVFRAWGLPLPGTEEGK